MSEGLKEYTKLNRYFKMKEMFDYLGILKDSGITNMFGASPFIWMGKSMIEHEFKYKDKANEEKYEELLSLANSVRDNLIYGSYKQTQENTNIDDDRLLRSVENKMRINAQEILKTWIKLKRSRTIRENEEKPKMSGLPSLFQRRFDGVKFEKKIRESITYAFRMSENVDQFVEIILETAVSAYLWDYYKIDTDNWDFAKFSKATGPLKEVYESLLKMMYYKHRKSNANR